jgi:hypothetical protein
MLTVRLVDCIECSSLSSLLEDIDCKLTELAKILYNNTIFALNRPIQDSVFIDLLNYKRILTARVCNSDYALYTGCTNCVATYTTEMIASKIKILKFK